MSRFFPGPEECGHLVMFGSTRLRTYAGEHLQLSLAEIPAEGVIDWHDHPNEQMGMVIQGRARFYIGDEEQDLGPGDFYWIPGSVRHRVVPIDGPVVALDIFYPIRPEYQRSG